MPKLLVLFHSRTGRTAALADAIAEGAKSVRFAEVDVRRIDDPAGDAASGGGDGQRRPHRTLDAAASVADYDGIILGVPAETGVAAPEVGRLLERLGALGRDGALSSKVGSAFASGEGGDGRGATTLWSALTALGKLGLILVPPVPSDPAADEQGVLAAARNQGKRVATVVEWVTHARSHAHGHGHRH
jgi:NAD(P)H dehydrogenase (quinone)